MLSIVTIYSYRTKLWSVRK